MVKKPFVVASLMSAAILSLMLGGCGSSKKEGAADPTSVATKIDNFNCTDTCHAGTLSKVTNVAISADWKLSKHATSGAADCQDCHGGGSNHWGLGPIPTANPDTDLVCKTCHASMPAPHGYTTAPPATGEAYNAAYVNSQDQGKCRLCHNPHNPTAHMPINVEWASSGKGTVDNPAWEHYDFKTRGHNGNPAVSTASDCVRCHTTTGFINYITSNQANVKAWGSSTDRTKEVLQCNACHDDTYNYASQRSVAAVTAFYNYSSRNTKKLLFNYTFPDVGKSNMCMMCHVGRESGQTLAAIAALPSSGASFVNYSTQSFINTHYLTAGATLFGVSGYEFAGAGTYADPVNYQHKSLGTATLPNGRAGVGPCVTCHMQATTALSTGIKASHKFKPEFSDVGAGANCVGCHTAQGVDVLSDALLAVHKAGYEDALAVLASTLRKRTFIFQQANPYFTKTNWQTSKTGGTTGGYGAANGKNMLGAAFNFNLLVHDPGAFAHNSIYTRRLIYDSIVFAATGGFTFPATTAEPVTVNNITELINNTTLVPAYTDLIASSSGPAVSLTPAMRAAAIDWLTHGTGLRP